jgi:hypothetical protein
MPQPLKCEMAARDVHFILGRHSRRRSELEANGAHPNTTGGGGTERCIVMEFVLVVS